MTDFRFKDEAPRVYHDLGLVEPGDVRDLEQAPDERWVEVKHKSTVKTEKE